MAGHPRFTLPRSAARLGMIALVFALGSASSSRAVDDCIADDNGAGTVTVPPAGCAFLAPEDVFPIIDGLPPGTTIELTPTYHGFSATPPAFPAPAWSSQGATSAASATMGPVPPSCRPVHAATTRSARSS